MLVVVALVGTGCSGDEGLGAGDAATVGEGSVAQFSADGGEWIERAAGETIPSGAQVRAASGELRLEFRSGDVRLAEDATATVTADRVTLERGEALVSSRGDLGAAWEDATVSGQGDYRLDTGWASRLGVYTGDVVVRRPAQQRDVPALRQLSLSSFRLGAVDPLQYRAADEWDRELLGDAIAFDGEAARLANGMDSQLGKQPRRLVFYRRFVKPAGALSTLTQMAAVNTKTGVGPPSDLLLPWFVAQAAPGAAEAAVTSVSDLRDSGARWGLIARELNVPSKAVVAAIDALGGRGLALDGLGLPRNRASAGAGEGNQVAAAAADAFGSGSDSATSDPGAGDGAADQPAGDTGAEHSGDSADDPADDPQEPTTKEPSGGGGDDPTPPEEPDPVTAVIDTVVTTVESGTKIDKSELPKLPPPLDDAVPDAP